MTSRTRKLTVGVVVAVVVMAVVAAAGLVANDDPPLAVKFLRYEGVDAIALQITNRSHSAITYITWHSDTNGTDGVAERVLKANWGRQVVIPMTGPHTKAGVVYVPSSLLDRISLFLLAHGVNIRPRSFVISVDLPPPPKVPAI